MPLWLKKQKERPIPPPPPPPQKKKLNKKGPKFKQNETKKEREKKK